jgi:non-ribosomal peptide synthase protein (TIGR01720 family)
VVMVEFDRDQTQVLLGDVPKLYQTQMHETLLAAVVQTVAEWTGKDQMLIDLEGHGREEILPGVDVSRTVGWFTSISPALLQYSRFASVEEQLREMRKQLQSIPRRGISYGILRYLSPEEKIRHALAELPQAEIIFNYLGQFDQVLSPASFLAPAVESAGLGLDQRGKRTHVLELVAEVSGGCLSVVWRYSQNLHRVDTIERLAKDFRRALERIIISCDENAPSLVGIPGVELTTKEFNELLTQLN